MGSSGEVEPCSDIRTHVAYRRRRYSIRGTYLQSSVVAAAAAVLLLGLLLVVLIEDGGAVPRETLDEDVSLERVLAAEGLVARRAREGLDGEVDAGMTVQIVSSREARWATRACIVPRRWVRRRLFPL